MGDDVGAAVSRVAHPGRANRSGRRFTSQPGQRPTGHYDPSATPTGPHIQVGGSKRCALGLARSAWLLWGGGGVTVFVGRGHAERQSEKPEPERLWPVLSEPRACLPPGEVQSQRLRFTGARYSAAVRLLHTSDWHLGRTFHGESLLSEQEAAVDRLVGLASEAEVDLVVIAGDLYDRAIPPADAVALFDVALVRLHATGARIVAIAGNHDSAARVAVGDEILERAGVTVRGDVGRCVRPLRFDPGDGGPSVAVYPVPYLEPALAGPVLSRLDAAADVEGSRRVGHNEVTSRATALIRRDAASGGATRTVVVAHTFVAGGTTTDSERDLTVGNVDLVDVSAFDGFDYVSLRGNVGRWVVEGP